MSINLFMYFSSNKVMFYIFEIFSNVQILHPVLSYNFMLSSFSHARVENEKLVVGKLHEKGSLLDSEPLAVTR